MMLPITSVVGIVTDTDTNLKYLVVSAYFATASEKTMISGCLSDYAAPLSHTSKLDRPQANKRQLNHCWFDVGPTSQTVAQHQTNIGSTSPVCWVTASIKNNSW